MLSIPKLENFLQSKRIAGVEAILLSEGGITWNVIVLAKNKTSINTESSSTALTNLGALKNAIPDKVPLAIVLNGKGIIHKKVFVNDSDNDKSILQKVLPNAIPEDFYFQKSSPLNKAVFVSVVRKGVVDSLIGELTMNNLNVVSFSMGPFTIDSIVPLLEDKPVRFDFQLGSHQLKFSENGIEEYSIIANENLYTDVKVGDNTIASDLVLSFAAAFAYLVGDEGLSNNITPVEESSNAYFQKQRFQLIGWGVLIFFLSVLMINYFFFNNYWTKKNELGSTVSLNQAAVSKYEKLNKEFEEKQEFLKKTGMLETSRTSYYADQLAADLPNTILLTLLNVNPVVKKVKLEEGISFNTKTIIIEGVSRRSTELNNWIKIIKTKNWVEEVALINYSQDESKVTGEFVLEVRVK